MSVITLFFVVLQFALLLQQNTQFDDALGQFKTVVQNYIWQVNTPGLWPTYLPDTHEIELVNYGQTPIGITDAALITHSGKHQLIINGPKRIQAGTAERIGVPTSFGAMDIIDGVDLEIAYIYLGNRYHLLWHASIVYIDGDPLIEPQGEPVVERLPASTPTTQP